MISNVNFTSRETLLTEGIGVAAAKTVDKFHEYLGVDAMLPRLEDTFVKEAKVVKESVAKDVAKAMASAKSKNAATEVENPELSYAISHGQPKSELVGKNINYEI